MRVWVFALAMIGCGNKEGAPKQHAAPTGPPTPADAATGCFKIEPKELVPEQVWVNDIVWRSPTQLVLAIGDNPHTQAAATPEKSGIALYDLSTTDKTPVTYRMPAEQIELMGDSVLVAGGGYLTYFEIGTGCVRQSMPLGFKHAAIDAVHGRFFILTANGLSRVELPELTVKVTKPSPPKVLGMAYDAISDRLVVLQHPGIVEMFDGSTLENMGSFEVDSSTQSGPWIRPGTGEAWFSHLVHCTKHEFDHQPTRMNLGRCMDPPKTVGSFLTRYELPSGKLLESIQALDGKKSFSEAGASFSGDGKQFFIADVHEGQLQAIGGKATHLFHLQTIKGKPQYTWGEGWTLPNVNALDDDGDRLAGWSDSYYLTIFETTTGKKLWNGHLPGKHPY